MKPLKSLAALALLLAGTGAAQAQALKPFTARYQASYEGLSADATMSLKTSAPGRWSYVLGVNNRLANLSQATTFLDKSGLYLPLGGADHGSYLGKRKAVTTRYDWATKQATWSGDVKPTRAGPVPLRVGDLDAMLVNLALVRDVAAGKQAMDYRVLENGKARPMNYRVRQNGTQTINGKSVQAVQLVQGNRNKQTVVWVAAGVPAPLRVVQYEDGKETLRLQMVSWQ